MNQIKQIIEKIESGELSLKIAKHVFRLILKEWLSVDEIMNKYGLVILHNPRQDLKSIIKTLDLTQDTKSLVKDVMVISKGRFNPAEITDLINNLKSS